MKGIVFDLDDTLYNEKDFVYGAFEEVAAYLAGKYGVEKQLLSLKMKELLKRDGRGRIFDSVCEFFGFPESIPGLVALYRKATPPISLYRDAEDFLIASQGKYKLGIITDGLSFVQWNKIRLLGIEKYFDQIIVTDDLGKGYCKPSPIPYEKMSESLEVPLNEMAYIGDNPNKDFLTARKLGILTVRVIREEGEYAGTFLEGDYEAQITIPDLYSLEKVL